MEAAEPTKPWGKPSLRTVVLFAVLLFACQAIDALCTVYFVARGHAVEANPFMLAWITDYGYGQFLMVKLAIAAVGGAVLTWASLRYRWAWIATRILLMILVLVLIRYHAYGFALYGGA